MFGVGEGIVKVWDTFLLTLTLLDACGWHVWGGWRSCRCMGPIFCCPKPFLVRAAEGWHLNSTYIQIHTNFDKDSEMVCVLLVMAVSLFCCTVAAELMLVSQHLSIDLSIKPVHHGDSLVPLAGYAVAANAVYHNGCWGFAGSTDVGDGGVARRGSSNQRYHDPLHLCFCFPGLPQLWRHLVSPLHACLTITVTTTIVVT